MTNLDTAVVAGVLGLVAGLGVPELIRRLPEPDPEPAYEAVEPEDGAQDEPKELYVDLAARPRLGLVTSLASGAAAALVGLATGWDPALVGLLLLVPVGVSLAVVDLRTRLLPSVVVLPTTVLLVVLAFVECAVTRDPEDLLRGAIGLVAARGFYWALWFVHSIGMGYGDVRLAALLGFALAYLGWAQFAVGMYAGFLVFGLPGLLVALVRWDRRLLRTAYPFGPAMILGALIGVCLGERILAGLAA